MLNELDLDCHIDKAEYKQRLPELQARLFEMEQALKAARIPALFIFEGWAGTSKIETIGLMTRRLDPRWMRLHAITPPRTFETLYPWLYRFWLKIPSYGQMAIFDRSWYREVLAARARHTLTDWEWHSRCEDIGVIERQLADDGAIFLKFWFHISQKEQKHRFKKLQADPVTAMQVTDVDRWQNKHYDQVHVAVQELLTRTDAPCAPWIVVPATDKHYANIVVFEAILQALGSRLSQFTPLRNTGDSRISDEGWPALRRYADARMGQHGPVAQPTATNNVPDTASLYTPGILRRVDLTRRLDDSDYRPTLARLQATLYLLGLQVYHQRRPVILVFEGWDAAGKGGTIQRITAKLDPRAYVVHSIAAPTGDDREHHYLYRFWRRIPISGMIGIFDRSWYGRVLVERVEGFARRDEWERAYTEINEFERQLVEFGVIICKFWLHISPEEQLRRFEDRKGVPYKAWKLTDEDWRNREQWASYEQAADEMLLRTSTPTAPWTIVEANDKRFARVKAIQTLVNRLEAELGKVKLKKVK
jgi:polyphosphate kinase 2 (PPK2 family)